MDKVQIYRVVDKSGPGFLYDEVCRECATDFKIQGFEIEFDGHLTKYVEEIDGVTYYIDGSDEENPEICCSQCDEYLFSEEVDILKYPITFDLYG